MKYTIQRLDKRYSHADLFQYYIGFSARQINDRGPECFNEVLQWFTRTYGWSAEIKQYTDIKRYGTAFNNVAHAMQRKFNGHPLGFRKPQSIPSCCNELWSWSNLYDDLRVYVATDRELTFFQLAFPVDQ
jgi:hypothetical protein